MDKPVGFFQDDNGNRSMMRLMNYQSLWAAMLVAVIILLNGQPAGIDGIMIFFGFLAGAFVPKAIQKMTERVGNKT